MGVAVVTDSQTCIPAQLAAELGVTVLPYSLQLDDRVYRDGIDITPKEFYELLPTLSQPATTSAIPPGAFMESYTDLAQEHDAILVITIASTMSATYANARLAADSFTEVPVEVIDSGTAAMAQGLVVLEVADAASRGSPLRDCRELALALSQKAELFAYISTFEYLKKSGRVNAVTAFAGEALSIKPVFRFKDGSAMLVSRKRSPAAAQRLISAHAAACGRERGPLRVAVFHANDRDNAERLSSLIAAKVALRGEMLLTEFTPVMGCHTGPGVVGVAFL